MNQNVNGIQKKKLARNLARFSFKQNDYSSLQSFFSQEALPGISTIKYGTGYLDVYFEDRGSKNTIVIFHAAQSKTWKSYPVFSGMSMMEGLDANIIAVSDPSLALGLELAWFAGNQHQRLQIQLPGVIRHILSSVRTAEKLIFFGASGGGFAALYYSYLFPESLALVANPQTKIGNYTKFAVDNYTEMAWDSLDLDNVNITSDLTKLYRDGFPNKIAYLQNIRDGHHRDRHLAPWVRGLDTSPNNLFLLLDDWGPGHIAPPVDLFRRILRAVFAAKNPRSWNSALYELNFVQSPSKTYAGEFFKSWSSNQGV
ncbi:hypothetical protein [Arthrobacter sp. MYb213]|uniref:hypothetical protein n=1 Tax=Arthrobacter sp. MYb213 TaxID=1848595 RepID=UPI000CFD07EA|nr:hypothetical protein [Arthrobacter sp. MYb213]PRB72736.1 hypothetical protein CQ011_03635 [Arthrobacter sp. MYb213]